MPNSKKILLKTKPQEIINCIKKASLTHTELSPHLFQINLSETLNALKAILNQTPVLILHTQLSSLQETEKSLGQVHYFLSKTDLHYCGIDSTGLYHDEKKVPLTFFDPDIQSYDVSIKNFLIQHLKKQGWHIGNERFLPYVIQELNQYYYNLANTNLEKFASNPQENTFIEKAMQACLYLPFNPEHNNDLYIFKIKVVKAYVNHIKKKSYPLPTWVLDTLRTSQTNPEQTYNRLIEQLKDMMISPFALTPNAKITTTENHSTYKNNDNTNMDENDSLLSCEIKFR